MSQTSQASTILYETSQDPLFREEILSVDRLYFQELPSNDTVHDNSLSQEFSFDDDSESGSNHSYLSDHDESDTEFDDELPAFSTEPTENDILNQELVQNFIAKACGCKRLYEKPCSTVINFEELVRLREYCDSLEKDELDLVVQSALFTHRQNGPKTSATSRHAQKDRQKPSQRFFIKGIEVCRQVFCFAYSIGREKLMKIGQALDQHGLLPRIHGNKNKLPHNALHYSDREQIKLFITRYANENAMPLPGRMPNHRQSKVLLLPTDKRQSDIHLSYLEVANNMGLRNISLSTFVKTWHELCPQIILGKPSTDLCHKCQMWSNKISTSGCLNEHDKSELLETYRTHIANAQLQRDQYREQCNDSKMLCSTFNYVEGVVLFYVRKNLIALLYLMK